MSRKTSIAAQFAVSVMLATTGCAGFHSSQDATQVYTLDPPASGTAAHGSFAGGATSGATSGAASSAVTLQVLRPLVAPGLDTDRIALTRVAQRMDYYAASRWPAPLPDLLQTLAIDSLRAAGKYRSVQSDAAAFAADEVLQIEVRRCQAEYAGDDAHAGAPIVHVQLVATVGRRSDHALLASVSADSARAANENRLQSVVTAFARAVDDALGQIAAQLP